MQDFAFLFVELHEFLYTILQLGEVPLVCSAIISCIIWKFVECACCPIVQVIIEDFQWQRTQYQHLRYITSD